MWTCKRLEWLNESRRVERTELAARSSCLFYITESGGVPRCLPHPLRTTSNSCPSPKPCISHDLSKCFLSVLFLSPFSSFLSFSSSFISISIIFFVSISASVCSSHCLDFGTRYSWGLSASILVSLSFILSFFSISWSVSIFLSLAWLSPQLPQSHKPSRPCSRQPPITGLQEWRGGGCREMGAWKSWGAVATAGEGERQKRAERCHS